jgi:hypothetical protein
MAVPKKGLTADNKNNKPNDDDDDDDDGVEELLFRLQPYRRIEKDLFFKLNPTGR